MFNSVTTDEKIKALMDTIRKYQGAGEPASIHSSIPTEANVATRKLCKLLNSLPVEKRAGCDQDYWLDFVTWFNTVHFGYFINLETMRAVINAFTDPKYLVKVADLRTYHDDICTSAIMSIKSQDLLQEVLERYIENSPVSYFQRNWSAPSDFRGGECLYGLLNSIDDEHFLTALRNKGKVPSWVQEDEIDRYKSSYFGGTLHLTIMDIVRLYDKKIDSLLKSNLVSEEESIKYIGRQL